MNKKGLISLIRECFEILFNEADTSIHSGRRLIERIKDKGIASEDEMNTINERLNSIKTKDFEKNLSLAIMLVQFNVNEDSPYATKENGKYYYKIKNEDNDNYSVGNQLWATIRENKIFTIMLRKDIQSFKGMDVNYILRTAKQIDDFKYIPNKK